MPDSGFRIARILVALDHSDDSRTTLAEAAALAARLQAELVGLFIEDVKLLDAAQLPFVRQISLTGHSAPMDRTGVERGFRAQEQAARQLMESVALRHRLSWSFRVARGRASVEILAQAQGVDLVIVGKTAPAVTRQGRIGATALAIADALRVLGEEPIDDLAAARLELCGRFEGGGIDFAEAIAFCVRDTARSTAVARDAMGALADRHYSPVE